jgi:thioredoxin 1
MQRVHVAALAYDARAMTPPAPTLTVACLCAAWCRTCDAYEDLFRDALAAHPTLRARWIDIEDEAELMGDVDIETFPTVVIADARHIYFAGPLTPQPETLQRVLRAALDAAAAGSAGTTQPAELQAFVQRLLHAG